VKKPRQTTYEVRCKGYVIAHIDSYYSIELEHGELLYNASKKVAGFGYNCFNVLENQHGVACEKLTVTAPKRQDVPWYKRRKNINDE